MSARRGSRRRHCGFINEPFARPRPPVSQTAARPRHPSSGPSRRLQCLSGCGGKLHDKNVTWRAGGVSPPLFKVRRMTSRGPLLIIRLNCSLARPPCTALPLSLSLQLALLHRRFASCCPSPFPVGISLFHTRFRSKVFLFFSIDRSIAEVIGVNFASRPRVLREERDVSDGRIWGIGVI